LGLLLLGGLWEEGGKKGQKKSHNERGERGEGSVVPGRKKVRLSEEKGFSTYRKKTGHRERRKRKVKVRNSYNHLRENIRLQKARNTGFIILKRDVCLLKKGRGKGIQITKREGSQSRPC